MGLTIREIRDRTTRARHLMQRSRQQGFAVGAFNIDNQETNDTILDDPDDDIENLDNPDTTVTEDNKDTTTDPNVREDDTQVPDNILNNTSDDNKQDSE